MFNFDKISERLLNQMENKKSDLQTIVTKQVMENHKGYTVVREDNSDGSMTLKPSNQEEAVKQEFSGKYLWTLLKSRLGNHS